MADICLQPQQQQHVSRLATVLTAHKCAIDTSVMGAGKTYTSSYIAALPEFSFRHVVVICPVSVQPKWDEMAARFGVPLARNISYHSLRAAKGRQPAHGLLLRWEERVELNGREFDKVRFAATPQLEHLLREGTLLVVDEFQHLKNVTAQFEAVRTLVAAVRAHEHSRCLFLSGSPFDKQEHATTLVKTLGFMLADHLTHFDLATRTVSWTGAQEVAAACAELDAPKTSTLRARYAWHPPSMVYALFQEVIKPALCSSMPHPDLAHRVHKVNAFYPMTDPALLPDLMAGIQRLKRACGFDSKSNTVNFAVAGGTDSMAALTIALVAIERAKIPTLARVAADRLRAHPTAKVVLCVNYTDSVEELKGLLAPYAPLVLDGRVAKEARARIIAAFQRPDAERRVLVGNVHVCSTGIDLDDKHGGFPRLCLVNPNYSTLTIHQLGHRFLRMDTRGDSEFHMVYIQQAFELPILNALARKGSVMKETTQEQVHAGVTFPSDYPRRMFPDAVV